MSLEQLFVSRLPDENIVSSMRIANDYLMEGMSPHIDGCYECGDQMRNCDTSDRFSSEDPLHKDILELLPANPFGMDMSSTFTAITSWLEDLEVDYQKRDGLNSVRGDTCYPLLTELDFVWNNDTMFHSFYDDSESEVNFLGSECLCFESDINRFCSYDSVDIDCDPLELWVDEDESLIEEAINMVNGRTYENWEESVSSPVDGELGLPHAALTYVLSHLDIRDLLMMETVCKSLHHTIRNDPLLWRNIRIDQPLNEKITDEILIQLASRSQGSLDCLSLLECPWLTDDALKHVLEKNPKISKLSVPGCTRLSIDGVIASLMSLKGTGTQGVKRLRVGGLFGVTMNHFEKMKSLLDPETRTSFPDYRPHFYHKGNLYVSCDDDRAIDIESCPICQNLRLVYDCPLDACDRQIHPTKHCRACTFCIPRCIECGQCICDGEYEETFCLELVCSECWNQGEVH